MKQKQLDKLIEDFLSRYRVIAPRKIGKRVLLKPTKKLGDVFWGTQMPEYPWRKFLFPYQDSMFSYTGAEIEPTPAPKEETMLFGINVLDLKALTFCHQVFSEDPAFQKRIKKMLLVGISNIPETEEYNVFQEKYSEEILEHLIFDIFIEKQKSNYRIFTGSEDGQRLLDNLGITEYTYVQHAGYTFEESPESRWQEIRDKLEKSIDSDLWKELGEICLGCGKCMVVCPTCYCFKLQDKCQLKPGKGKRIRKWDACFYSDFSAINQGKEVFLDNAAKRIYFWYHHKFVRDFDKYKVPGCVGCGRCSKTCPVGIKLNETLSSL